MLKQERKVIISKTIINCDMKKLLLCLLMFQPLWMLAQSSDQAEAIKQDPNYLYGEGFGDTEAAADQAAMQNLMSKISVQVEADFRIDEREVSSTEGNSSESAVQNVVRTYSRGTLKNTGSIIITPAPKAQVLRYIKRSDLDRMFKDREELIMSYVYSARNAEKRGRLDTALRSYYWASCLLKRDRGGWHALPPHHVDSRADAQHYERYQGRGYQGRRAGGESHVQIQRQACDQS